MCPPRLCPRADRYGNPHYNILHRRRERLDHTIAGLRRSRRPTLTFHHSVLPHVPWSYLPTGQAREGYRDGTLPDFASPAGFGDEFLTLFNEQRHLLQAGFADAEVGPPGGPAEEDEAVEGRAGGGHRRPGDLVPARGERPAPGHRGQHPRGGAGAAVRQAARADTRRPLDRLRERPGRPAHHRRAAAPAAGLEDRRRQRVRPRRAGAAPGAHAAPRPVRRRSPCPPPEMEARRANDRLRRADAVRQRPLVARVPDRAEPPAAGPDGRARRLTGVAGAPRGPVRGAHATSPGRSRRPPRCPRWPPGAWRAAPPRAAATWRWR